jgi:hypothetical protein
MATAGGPAPAIGADSVSLAPGESAPIAVNFSASALAAGQYEGFIRVADTSSGRVIRVPYWYAVPSNTPKHLTVLDVSQGRRPLESVTDAVLFRVTDSSGIPITDIKPEVTVVSGGGVLMSVNSRDRIIPGAFGITLRLGPSRGSNVVRIRAGDVAKEVTIASK